MIIKPLHHYYLALNQIKGVGTTTMKKLLSYFGSIDKIFNASIKALEKTNLPPNQIKAIKQFDWRQIEPSLIWANMDNHTILTWENNNYPLQLKMIDNPPPLLFVAGNPEKLNQPQIAIVGSRHPTLIGSENSLYFAQHLAEKGFTITSGLAIGIDYAAHRGALNATGSTIAILGSGIDYIYPHKHHKLADEIIIRGAIVSEFPLGTAPQAKNFPQRNRIISGLSMGTLVIEAAIKSGSLLSANYAVQQGREVFALPGSIHNPLAKGCHQLIQQGAKLVQTINDIIEELPEYQQLNKITPSIQPCPDHSPVTSLNSEEKKLLSAIGEAATPFNTIMTRCNLGYEKTLSTLLTLQMHGLIAAVIGGYCRTSTNRE